MADSYINPYALPVGTKAFPTFSLMGGEPAQPAQPNFITSALSSGFHEALGNVGGAVQAVGTGIGAGGLAEWGRSLAESQRQAATEAGRPDLEGPDFWSPKGIAYQVLKGVPTLAGALGTGAGVALTAGESLPAAAAYGLGGALFGFPQAVGGNVEAARSASGGKPLTPGEAAKSLALGVPEAVAMGVMPSQIAGPIERFAGNAGMRALKGGAALGAYQAGLSAAQTAVTQQAFTPDMPIADRARQIVDSALGGGLQGAVFGGVTSALRKAPGVTDRPAGEVSTEDLNKATATALRVPSGAQEAPAPLPPQPPGPYSNLGNEDLAKLIEPLAAKGDALGGQEAVVHGLLREELTRRTQPGLPPGTGTLFTPEQIAERAPAIAETKAKALQAAGGGGDNVFFQNFNAASEPELINALTQRVAQETPKSMPSWLKTLGTRYGVIGPDPAEQVVNLSAQEAKSWEARQAAEDILDSGRGGRTAALNALQAANVEIFNITPKLAEARRLLDLHDQAAKLLPQEAPPAVQEKQPKQPKQPKLPKSLVDKLGQLNLPGFGKAPLPVPEAEPAPEAQGPIPGQRELFTSEQQVARDAAVKAFQDRVLAPMGPRVRAQVEPLIRSMDVANEPELINELRSHLTDTDPPIGFGHLMKVYGVTDDSGRPVNAADVGKVLQARYDDLITRAGEAKTDTLKERLLKQASDLRKDQLGWQNQLADWHAQADELGAPVPTEPVPDRVPEGLAQPWSLMETIKKTEGVDPKAAAMADTAQRAIEANLPQARQIANRAIQEFTKSTRNRVVTEREGAVPKPSSEGLLPREPAETGGAVGQGDTQGNAPSKESVGKAVEQAVKETPAPAEVAALPAEPLVADPPHWEREVGQRVEEEPGTVVAQPRVLMPTAEGFYTGDLSQGAKKIVEARAKPPLPKPLDPEAAKAKLQALLDGGQLRPGERTLVENALASPDPTRWQSAENALADIRAVTGHEIGTPFTEEPAPLPKRRQRKSATPAEPVAEPAPAASEEPAAPTKPVIQLQDEVPDWIKPGADDRGGDVVHAEGDFGLVRGFGKLTGRTLYLPAKKIADGLVSTGDADVRQSRVSWLDPKTKAELIKKADQAKAADDAAYKANPDGPFKDATDKVVGDPTVDPRTTNYIRGLLTQLGIDARVLVVHPEDVRGAVGDAIGLHGPYASARSATKELTDDWGQVRNFGPDNTDFYIMVNPKIGDRLTVETAAHEVGHIVAKTALLNAPKETQDAIEQAHQKWYKDKYNVPAQDLIRATRNYETADTLTRGMTPESKIDNIRRNYLLSKDEWFADNVSRWATTAEKPRTLVDKFFSYVGEQLKKFMTAVTGNRFMPDAAVHDFLDHLWTTPTSPDFLTANGGKIPTTTDTGPRTVRDTDTTAQSAISNFGKIHEGVNETLRASRGVAPRWLLEKSRIARTLNGIRDIDAPDSKPVADYVDTHTQRGAITDIKNKPDVKSAAAFMALKPEVQKMVDRHLEMLQNPFDLSSKLPWEAHTDLLEHPDADVLKQRHREMVSDLSRLQQAGGKPALDSILQMMQTKRYESVAALLHSVGENWAGRGVEIPNHGVNPDKTYQNLPKLHDDPTATNKFYKDAVTSLRDGIKQYVDAQKAAAAEFMNSDPKKYAKLTDPLDELTSVLRGVDTAMVQAGRGTYSPLSHGRGNFFVSAHLPTGEDGAPLPEAAKAIQNALEKEGYDIGVFHDTDSSTIMTRVENQAKMNRLTGLFQKLEQDGHLSDIKNGRPDNLNTMADLGPKYMKAMAEAVRSATSGLEDVDPKTADAIQAQLMSRWLDMLPDRSAQKYLQPRKFVSGYDKNMAQAAIQAAKNISRSSTAVSMQGQFAKVREAMRQEINDAKSDVGSNKSLILQGVSDELALREAQGAWQLPTSVWDTAQAAMHTLRIGFNPPYMLTMMSQIPTLLHPELAKKYGYAKSALAIGGATGRAFNAIRAVLSSPDWATAGFRDESLRKAGNISDKDIDTIMKLDNGGGLSNNTYTTAMTDLGEGASAQKNRYKNMANAMGLYSEMLPRLVAALSAGDLYDKRPVAGMTRDEYIRSVVSGSQFDWGPGQSSRLTGKAGPLGGFGKIAFGFMQFQTNMVQKLYSEMHDLFSKNSSPELRREAGTFLAGHMVAMTAIAGTLGLPAASFLAGLVDKMAGALTGRDDIDTIGLYRTWMANTFGPEVADVIAKGLPRAVGMDLSHLGDQNLLPGTSIMVGKRKFEDAEKDWFKSMAGSAFGEAGDLYMGVRDMMNGDYLKGAIRMMPEGAKGVAEAYWLSKYGYVDSKGNAYPVQPGARDKLMALLGIDPANLAQYEEADRIKSGLNAQRQYREQNISSHLVKGLMVPGSADVPAWMHEAVQYQLDHPGMGGPLDSLQSDISKFVTKSAAAGAFTTPLGVSPLNLGVRQATGFITPQRQ